MKLTGTILLLLFTAASFGQTTSSYSSTKKGQYYFLWGWNRGFFSRSNIKFKGADYDFKLYKVSAHDRPTPFSYHNYLKINRLTIPQTDVRFGYFIKDNLAVSLGFDHMKYVMDQNQWVKITGTIDHPGAYNGTYNDDIELTTNFLKYEHTNGLNYINVEAEKFKSLYHSKSNKLIVQSVLGGGVGFLFPRTDATLLNYERNDEFHVSGFGLHAKAGMQTTLFKHLLIKLETKFGYINMPDVRLHKKGITGKAKQAFWFNETDVMLGASFGLGNKKSKRLK